MASIDAIASQVPAFFHVFRVGGSGEVLGMAGHLN